MHLALLGDELLRGDVAGFGGGASGVRLVQLVANSGERSLALGELLAKLVLQPRVSRHSRGAAKPGQPADGAAEDSADGQSRQDVDRRAHFAND